MEKQFINTGRHLLKLLKKRQVKLQEEYEILHPYLNVVMYPSQKKDTDRTYYYTKQNMKPKYLGNEKSDIVWKVKRARNIAYAKTAVESDIALLEKLVNGFKFTGFEDITLALPKTYRLRKIDYHDDLPQIARNWIKRKEAEKAGYGPWHPEGLIHTVSNGIKVRTKSEMAIAEILLRNRIPFVYELPHRLHNGKIVHTDFTILSTIDYKTEILIEHEGSMDDSVYRQKHAWRVENYYMTGYVPNVDLFFTFDGANGSVDGTAVQRIVDGWLKPTA